MKKEQDYSPTEEELLYQFVGRKIKYFRGEINLNQADLAKLLQLSRTSVVNIEQGRQKPTLFLLWNVSRCLKKDLIDFFPPNEDITDSNTIDTSVLKFIQTLKSKP